MTPPSTKTPVTDVQRKPIQSPGGELLNSKNSPQNSSNKIKTPKRANLFTLGFQPVAKAPENPAQNPTKADNKEESPTLIPEVKKLQQPRRIPFTTLSGKLDGKNCIYYFN